ncbi:hypothetical protein AWZ03_006679 [Drosophila navojoa]|uniref:GPI ethanolamine phosphate transferase 1 n=2 Tax=Drosophila navojoa TaxID=7232 RepID=A0A484BGQ0_DRONA|nr:GPI ethanolamine phosphate transferase 1 isoform X1 [Drosophila navojoa]TDG46975.1 hypothetical protein AWZ03_006679 [Drosophila navojoa]
MWKYLALLVHILLLGYISLIYFQSSVINGMEPQSGHRSLGLQPPADRLVVFLIDGLRAESLYRNKWNVLPNLKHLFMDHGLIGISHGSAPTESRPGHISIFGGFQEDAAAALRNFKRNPSVFDTIFNRTMGGSWAWGSKSVLKFLKHLPNHEMYLDMHTESELTGNKFTHKLLYNKVRKFLAGSFDNATLPSVFLVDFDSLVGNGAVLKPNSDEFFKALNSTETVINQLYNLFEKYFGDQRTVYLLTSDHGMTDMGDHGEDSLFEIEMPFIFWGAGIERLESPFKDIYAAKTNGTPMQFQELKQEQLAPLMSALIGLPPPLNNRASLVMGMMNVSRTYEAHSMYLNARQILAQVEKVFDKQERSYIWKWMPQFERLNRHRIAHFHEKILTQIQSGCLNEAILCSQRIIHSALECLEYYKLYYRIPLVVACMLTYLGWFYYLLAKQGRAEHAPTRGWFTIANLILLLIELLVALTCFLHSIPCSTSFYLLVPVPMWALALREQGLQYSCMRAPLIQLAWIGAAVVLFIATYFFKPLIALGYLIVVCANNGHAFTRAPRLRFWLWVAVVALLTGFTVKRPDFGCNTIVLVFLSMLVTILRPLLMNERHACRVWLSNGTALLLGVYLLYERLSKIEINCVLQGAAWFYVFYAFISIPYSNTKTPRRRVQLILFNLSTVYTLLSVSYESIFMQLLCTEFLLGMQVDTEKKNLTDSEDSEGVEDEVQPNKSLSSEEHVNKIYRYAVLILVYAYFSMIGTGNLLNISAFDTSFAHIFVSDCSTVLILLLYTLKVMIPLIIIISSLYAFRAYARYNLRGIFICLFLICDVLCLYFFFFVRNSGSWRNVRESVSQQLIAHGVPMLLAAFSFIPNLLLSAVPLTMLPMLNWKKDVKMTQLGQSQV